MKCFVLLLDYHIVTSAALTGRAGGNGFNVSKKKSEWTKGENANAGLCALF